MSIFENEEQKLLEIERQEAEELASIERQKELDEINETRLVRINTLIKEAKRIVDEALKNTKSTEDEEMEESIRCGQDLLEALTLLRATIMVADPRVGQPNNVVKLPEGYYLGQTVYMIPTKYNGLTKIISYKILSFGLNQLGPRADLSIDQKERGIETLYCASFDMFNKSIFKTYEEAKSFMEGC